MHGAFAGFSTEALAFLSELERNNEREWFEAHKHIYLEHLKGPMERFVTALGAEMVRFAPNEVTTPAKAIYRIYRDTRFSNDKTPYKTHLGASFFRADLGKHVSAHYYVEISPKYTGIAGGIYMPDAPHLAQLRGHVAAHFERLDQLLRNKKLAASMGTLQGEGLSRAPKGFPPDHPAINLLKMKHLYFWAELPPETALRPSVVKEVIIRFRLMQPVMEFMNEPFLADKTRRAPMETGWI